LPTPSNALPLAALAIVAAVPCAFASAPHFTVTPIIIGGNSNFNATSVNSTGTVVGTLFDNTSGTVTGMQITGGTVTALPSPGGPFGPFNPRSINDLGDVLGFATNSGAGATDMFLLQSGTFNTAYQAPLVEPGNASSAPPLPIVLTNNLKVSFNTIISISGPIITHYGVPPNYHTVPQQNRFTHINSVNLSARVAGTAYSFNGISSVYTGKGKTFVTITPPNAKSVTGGYINDAGKVAGSFEDTAGAYHGFIYAAGNITTYDMPVASTSVTVNAINHEGRVVGVFTDSAGAQHAFRLSGTTVYTFGQYAGSDTVVVAIGNKGAMVVSDQSAQNPPVYQSETVTCSGRGC
jgi:probable HAF family extracellular repeat protein